MKEIYQILSAAMGQEKRLDQIANNLANVNSIGFKQDRLIFNDFMKEAAAANGVDPATIPASTPSISNAGQGYTVFAPGPAIDTGGQFDLYIEGEGFFEIEGETGTYYTRAGNFGLNSTGELVNAEGRRVLDGSGSPITLDPNRGEVTISPNGDIVLEGSVEATLQVVNFADPNLLTKYGEGLFEAPAGVTPVVNEEAKLLQGFLEGSNVNPVEEMIRLIETQRAFNTHQKAMQAIDDAVGARINQILR